MLSLELIYIPTIFNRAMPTCTRDAQHAQDRIGLRVQFDQLIGYGY